MKTIILSAICLAFTLPNAAATKSNNAMISKTLVVQSGLDSEIGDNPTTKDKDPLPAPRP